jgi:hypothetical protein
MTRPTAMVESAETTSHRQPLGLIARASTNRMKPVARRITANANVNIDIAKVGRSHTRMPANR